MERFQDGDALKVEQAGQRGATTPQDALYADPAMSFLSYGEAASVASNSPQHSTLDDYSHFGPQPSFASIAGNAPMFLSDGPQALEPTSSAPTGPTAEQSSTAGSRQAAKLTKMRPCDECRRRKSGSIMLQDSNTCLTCQVHNVPCTFLGPKPPKPRKKAASTSASSDWMGTATADASSSSKKRRHDSDGNAPPAASDHPTGDVDGIRYVSPVQDYNQIRGHSLLKKTLSLQFPRSSVYLGDTSVLDNLLFDPTAFGKQEQAQLAGNLFVRKAGPDTVFLLTKDDSPRESVEAADAIERLVAPHGSKLISLYFRVVHPVFPVLDKEVFLEKYARTHREFMPCLLASVYMLALRWWYYDDLLSTLPKPNIFPQLHELAISSFFKNCGHPKIPIVQAGVLLIHCQHSDDRNWIVASQVVSCAERIGLGLNCQNWKIPKWERGLRKRLAWAVFLLDKWQALIESQPSHITDDFWLVGNLQMDDIGEPSGFSRTADSPASVPDEFEYAISGSLHQGFQVYLEMVHLGQIVSEILDTLFTYRSKVTITDTEKILELAKPIQIKLRQWYIHLPESLQMNSHGSGGRQLSVVGYLHLAYFGAEVTLHRRIIRSLHAGSHPELVKVCREAAKARLSASLEFINSLTDEHTQSFWHFSAAANFSLIGSFAALLYVTSREPSEAEYFRSQLQSYMWKLRTSSGFDEMTSALKLFGITMSRISALGRRPSA